MAFSTFSESSAAADGAGSSVTVRINANKALIHRFPTIFCLPITSSFVRLLVENQCRLICIYCFHNAYSRAQIHGLGPVQFARLSYGRLSDSGLLNAILPQPLHPDFALKTGRKRFRKRDCTGIYRCNGGTPIAMPLCCQIKTGVLPPMSKHRQAYLNWVSDLPSSGLKSISLFRR